MTRKLDALHVFEILANVSIVGGYMSISGMGMIGLTSWPAAASLIPGSCDSLCREPDSLYFQLLNFPALGWLQAKQSCGQMDAKLRKKLYSG